MRDVNFVVAEALMLQASVPQHGVVVIVEGLKDDRLYSRFLVSGNVTCQADGKENAVGAIHQLRTQGQCGNILAIVDADFSRLNGPPRTPGLLLSQHHDSEMMILCSDALSRFVEEYASPAKLKRLRQQGQTVLDLLLTTARPLGHFRHLNERNGWNLRFKGIDLSKHVNAQTLKLDVAKVVAQVLSNTPGHGLHPPAVLQALQGALNDPAPALRELCHGHDCCRILAKSLRRRLASQRNHVAEHENVEKVLRLTYESEDFRKSSTLSEARAWEAANHPHVVFR